MASNERDAIELAKSQPPDVVVMDVYLGGTRGFIRRLWLTRYQRLLIEGLALGGTA